MNNIYFYQTSIGEIGIAENKGSIVKIYFEKEQIPRDNIIFETGVLKEAARQLQDYLAGKLREFDLPLAPSGTEFMRLVWEKLLAIPYGETWNCQEIARDLGGRKAARAVGHAVSHNPIPIFVPCHRVIGASGKPPAYRGGLEIKSHLLGLEKQSNLIKFEALKIKSIFLYQTDIGEIGIAANENAVTNLYLKKENIPRDVIVQETELIKEAARQLRDYLAGKLRGFDLPLAPAGTEFMRRVWDSLRAIPYGETRSYQEIAQSVGNKKASRAVGLANNRNPIPIFIPCHRVIGANGKLVGYGGGLEIKARLLELEKLSKPGLI